MGNIEYLVLISIMPVGAFLAAGIVLYFSDTSAR